VAEDDSILREILDDGLRAEGFDVVVAKDGAEALHSYLTFGPFDALLLDEEMPQLTGRQLLLRLREKGDRVPALLISGNLELDEAERTALQVGPVLRKPIPLRELAQALRAAIARAPG
jgi:DNA-binding response OmpR family regulator